MDAKENGDASSPPSSTANMASEVLNFNKPCTACRRRKVRCDKAQPCNNCTRHGVTCVYETSRDSVASQQILQERVERLERMVEDMASFSVSGHESAKYGSKGSPSRTSSGYFDEFYEIPPDTGSQVFAPGQSYHIDPDNWLSLDSLVDEPRYMLNNDSNDTLGEPYNWPFGTLEAVSRDMSYLHLPVEKEDVLSKLFFEHVDPFIKACHPGYFWQMAHEVRQGNSPFSKEMEAFMFAVQYMTACVLPESLLFEKVGLPRRDLICHFRRATEIAFQRTDLLRSRNTLLFSAFVHYISASFYTGDIEVGSCLLGLGVKFARRTGLHRDPRHYGYPPWIVELRRRMWGQFACLDAQSNSFESTLSCLTPISDVRRAVNVDDDDWAPSRVVGRDPGPKDREGFTSSTWCLMVRECSRVYQSILERRKTAANCDELMCLIDDSEKYIRLKFFHHFDGADIMQHIIMRWFRAFQRAAHILIVYLHASTSRQKLACHSFKEFPKKLFTDCIACLEDFEQVEIAARPKHWDWILRWPIHLRVIAGLLRGLASQPNHPDCDRAWRQTELVFQRFNNNEITMNRVPAWHAIEALCDEAMQKHPARPHEGRCYTKRIYAHDYTQEAEDTTTIVNMDALNMQGMMMGDLNMLGPDVDPIFSGAGPMGVSFPTDDPDLLQYLNDHENMSFQGMGM